MDNTFSAGILWPQDIQTEQLELPDNQLSETDILRVDTTLPIGWSDDWKPLESTDRRSMLGLRKKRLVCECDEIFQPPWDRIYRLCTTFPFEKRNEYCEHLVKQMDLLRAALSKKPLFILLTRALGWFGKGECKPLRWAGMKSVYDELQKEPSYKIIHGKRVQQTPGYFLEHIGVDIWYDQGLNLRDGYLFGKNDTAVDYCAIVAHFTLTET